MFEGLGIPESIGGRKVIYAQPAVYTVQGGPAVTVAPSSTATATIQTLQNTFFRCSYLVSIARDASGDWADLTWFRLQITDANRNIGLFSPGPISVMNPGTQGQSLPWVLPLPLDVAGTGALTLSITNTSADPYSLEVQFHGTRFWLAGSAG